MSDNGVFAAVGQDHTDCRADSDNWSSTPATKALLSADEGQTTCTSY